jgi:hypothetical protein
VLDRTDERALIPPTKGYVHTEARAPRRSAGPFYPARFLLAPRLAAQPGPLSGGACSLECGPTAGPVPIRDASCSDNQCMSTLDFQDLRAALSGLSLHEVDFSVGDGFVSRLRDVKVAIDQLNTSAEPWVAKWLAAEHLKAAMLWTAAKTNWGKEQSDGTDQTFSVRTRASLITRFNTWVVTVEHRLDTYEATGRSASVVAPWIAELERFRQDPVQNP